MHGISDTKFELRIVEIKQQIPILVHVLVNR